MDLRWTPAHSPHRPLIAPRMEEDQPGAPSVIPPLPTLCRAHRPPSAVFLRIGVDSEGGECKGLVLIVSYIRCLHASILFAYLYCLGSVWFASRHFIHNHSLH